MSYSLIKDLQANFGSIVSWHDRSNGLTKEGWFLLEINPFPVKDELYSIISDIENGRAVGVTGGQLTHLNECSATSHVIRSNVVRKATTDLKEQTFKVAIYAGKTSLDILKEQPIAIVIEPEISYLKFPDHPHLNGGGYDVTNHFYFPNSLCYTDDPYCLGDNMKDRLLEAFSQISIWLFRHQIWEATRKRSKTGEWIGPEGEPIEIYNYPLMLNPNGSCRCGSGNRYSNCHRKSDLIALFKKVESDNLLVKKSKTDLLSYATVDWWNQQVGIPNNHSLQKLKDFLFV